MMSILEDKEYFFKKLFNIQKVYNISIYQFLYIIHGYRSYKKIKK